MGRLSEAIKEYFKSLIEQGKQEVDILEANAEIHKIIGGMEGRLIELPCKEGDTVYIVGSKYRHGYFEDYINTGKFDITDLPKLGNSVFLTKAEAEKALEEMEK